MSEHTERLEYLRTQLRAGCISYGEMAELQSLAEHIEPGDVELLEPAGVPEEVAYDPKLLAQWAAAERAADHQPPTNETEGRSREMNGHNIPDHGGRTVYENAVRATESVIERAIRHNDQREANPEWDVRAEVYGKSVGRVEQYMIAGNGPTEYVCFVFDEDGDLNHAYLYYASGADSAVVLLGQFDGEDLYKQMRSYH